MQIEFEHEEIEPGKLKVVAYDKNNKLIADLVIPWNQPVITRIDGWDYDLFYSSKTDKLTITEFKDEWPVIV